MTLGKTSMSLEDLLSPHSNLMAEKWLDLVPSSNVMESKPVGLRVAISAAIPTPAPYTLHMSCFQPVRAEFRKQGARVVDEYGKTVLNLQMRNLRKPKDKKGLRKRVVIGITQTGKTCVLASFVGSKWSMVDSPWSLDLPSVNDDGHLLEMTGPHTVRLYPGGRLDYESSRCKKHEAECQHEPHLITAVKFSADEPYGTAVASLDTKTGTVKVKEEWFLLPALIVTFTVGNILRKGKCNDVNAAADKENMAKSGGCGTMAGCGSSIGNGCGMMAKCVACSCGNGVGGGCGIMEKGGACASCGKGVGGGCRTMAKSGACGLGGGCETMKKSGPCGLGGGCRTMAKGGFCGLGGGCGTMAKSGSCGLGGSACGLGGGCGTMAKGGACVLGGGCGNTAKGGACGLGGGGCGVGGPCVSFGSDGGVKDQIVAGNEIEVA